VAAVGLDQGVVDALGLEPGEQEVPQPVGRHVVRQPGGVRVAGEQGAHASGRIWLLPGGFEQVGAAGLVPIGDVQGQGLAEGLRERRDPVFAALAVGDADPAGVQVDVIDADGDKLGHADAGVEQCLDQDHVAAAPGLPDGLVVAADLVLAGHVGQRLGLALHVDVEAYVVSRTSTRPQVDSARGEDDGTARRLRLAVGDNPPLLN